MSGLFEFLKKNHTKIHYWGLGFIQVKVGKDVNYHFFLEDLPVTFNSETPHNHMRDFYSTVLFGVLEETLYEVTEGTGCKIEPNRCTGSVLPEVVLNIVGKNIIQYEQGSSYYRQKEQLHTVKPVGECLTVVVKQGDTGCVYSLGSPEGDGESVNLDDETLWKMVEDFCKDKEL